MVYARFFCKSFSKKRTPHTAPLLLSLSHNTPPPPPPTSSLLPSNPTLSQPSRTTTPLVFVSLAQIPLLSFFYHKPPTLLIWLSAWYMSKYVTHLGSLWLQPMWSCDGGVGLRQSDLSLSLSQFVG